MNNNQNNYDKLRLINENVANKLILQFNILGLNK